MAALAVAGVQLATSVGPVVVVWQVMRPPGVQLPTGTGVQRSVEASQELICEVLWRCCSVLACNCDVELLYWTVLCLVCVVVAVVCVVLCWY